MTVNLRLDDEPSIRAAIPPLISQRHLTERALLVVLGDAEHHAIMAVAVDDVPVRPSPGDRVQLLGPLLRRLRDALAAESALLIISRPGPPDADPGDLAWCDAFSGAAGTAHLGCQGAYLATPGRVTVLRRAVLGDVDAA